MKFTRSILLPSANALARQVAFFLVIMTASVSSAASVSSSFNATARSVAYLKHTSTLKIHTYTVAPENVTNGFVDLPKALRLDIKTNLRNGRVDFHVASNHEGGLLFKVNDGDYASDELRIHFVDVKPGETFHKDIDLRIPVDKAVKPGTYTVAVSVQNAGYY